MRRSNVARGHSGVPVYKLGTHTCCLRPDRKCLHRRLHSLHSDKHSRPHRCRCQRTALNCTLGLSCSLEPPQVAVLMDPEDDTCPVACTHAQTDQAWGLWLQSSSSSAGTAVVLRSLKGDTCPVACTHAQTDQTWGLALLQC